MREEVRVFAPATVANLGPGFDHLGMAVTGPGDVVTARAAKETGVRLEKVTGETRGLPDRGSENTATLAATKMIELLGFDGKIGVELSLDKGLPVGSGLGGSAASAVAAALATARLFSANEQELILKAALFAESRVSGYHADNVVPCLLGGLVLVHDERPDFVRIPTPPDLRLVLATPSLLLATRRAREVLPESVSLGTSSSNSARLGAMIAAAFQGQTAAFAQAVRDEIVEPARAPLIPGFQEVKRAALQSGAFACSISGAGPTVFAIVDSEVTGNRVGQAMVSSFARAGVQASFFVARVDTQGAREIEP